MVIVACRGKLRSSRVHKRFKGRPSSISTTSTTSKATNSAVMSSAARSTRGEAPSSPLNTKTFKLLDLPWELRFEIYQHIVDHESGREKQIFIIGWKMPTAFLVCKQVHAEAIRCLLSRNHFHLYEPQRSKPFLKLVGEQASNLKAITICHDWQSHWLGVVEELLRRCTHLREIRMRKASAYVKEDAWEKYLIKLRLAGSSKWARSAGPGEVSIFRRVQGLKGPIGTDI